MLRSSALMRANSHPDLECVSPSECTNGDVLPIDRFLRLSQCGIHPTLIETRRLIHVIRASALQLGSDQLHPDQLRTLYAF